VGQSKVYAVVLFEQAADEFGKLVALWLRENELQLPHQFVKAVFYAADAKKAGFV
jgi:hypothetical protein